MLERELKILLIVFLSFGLTKSFAQSDFAGNQGNLIDANSRDIVIFRFKPRNEGFFALCGDNVSKLKELSDIINKNIDDIKAGRLVIRVNGYCTSMPTVKENLQVAKTRSNHVKSWYIINNGLKEHHFRTYNSARSWNGQSEIVAVAYLEVVDRESHTPGVVKVEVPAVSQEYNEHIPAPGQSQPADTIARVEVIEEYIPQYPAEPIIDPAFRDELPVELPQKESGTFVPKLGVKTNLLYWAGIMPDFKYYSFLPNLELEWYFNQRWSLAATGAYSKWSAGGDKFFGVSAWSIEPRYWVMGDNNWIYVGLFGEIGDFDNQNIHIDEFGRTGDFYGGGLSVGTHIPFGRRWGFEIGIRGGMRHTKTDIYSWEPPYYYWDRSETKNKWGITGIKASVVYRFGRNIK